MILNLFSLGNTLIPFLFTSAADMPNSATNYFEFNWKKIHVDALVVFFQQIHIRREKKYEFFKYIPRTLIDWIKYIGSHGECLENSHSFLNIAFLSNVIKIWQSFQKLESVFYFTTRKYFEISRKSIFPPKYHQYRLHCVKYHRISLNFFTFTLSIKVHCLKI